MSSSRFPNKTRFFVVANIYHNTMIPFIEEALEHDRIHSALFNDQAKSRDPRKYANGMRKLEQGAPVSDLIDHADIPHLVGDNLKHFSGLNRDDVDQMHSIRQLWNDLKHDNALGDFHPEDTADFMAVCTSVLRRCDLNEAADEIASLSSPTPAISASALAAADRKLAQPGYDIKPPQDWFAADRNQQLRHRAVFARPVQHRLASSMSHDLVLREDGSVAGWGQNHYGQCNVPNGKFIAVSAGRYHSLGLREDRSVACWGDNISGQRNAPSGKFIAISAGGYHSIGLRENGTVACWGDNSDGQCNVPVGRFTAVSAGMHHSIGLREDGSVVCWGDNNGRQCNAPDGKFTAVSAGGHHSIGLHEDGSAVCWGDNTYRQRSVPSGKFIAISAGMHHSIGLRDDGSVVCWGDNNDGQCNAPDGKFTAVSAGGYHSLGLREDGSVAHWGWQGDERGDPRKATSSRDG